MKIVTENRSKNADTNREIVFHEIYPSQEREREREREREEHCSSARVKNLQRAARDQLTPGWPFRSLQPPLGWCNETRRIGTRRSSRKPRLESRGKRQGYYTQRSFFCPWEGVVGRRATSICLVRLPHQERPRIPRASITSSSYQPHRTAPVYTLPAPNPPACTYIRARSTRALAFFIPLSLSLS